jgi:hypothetical protein
MVGGVKERARSLAAVQAFPLFLPLPVVMGECSQDNPEYSLAAGQAFPFFLLLPVMMRERFLISLKGHPADWRFVPDFIEA